MDSTLFLMATITIDFDSELAVPGANTHVSNVVLCLLGTG